MTNASAATDAGIPGRGHVDLNRQRRTDSALAARFIAFADLECAPGGSGMSVNSPTYAVISRHVAVREPLLALARECQPGQPIPNLLFAAVKHVAADTPDTPLGHHYRRVAEGAAPAADLVHEFDAFCRRHAHRIAELVRARNVQTNEVGRCSHLMPAFCVIARETGRNLALIDIGAGAGLNLLWNRFDYRYSNGAAFGSGRSPVRIACESRGEMPPLPSSFPDVSFAVGVDLNPIDLVDDEQYRWLEALIWPEHADRAALLASAREVWLKQPPRVEAGDALEWLPDLVAEAPADAALCLFHCHALNQFSVQARESFAGLLRAAAQSRPLFHVSSEGETLVVTRLEGGRSTQLLSVLRNAHGRWIKW
ncbi:MAG: DUF2332 domain-containing protein [Gammaproteobacteria bacterium]|nr:DUF2332 domain-containing protein [Gammaproteobacteria bacterium]MYF30460.1 DUF2332 domain-containing protein [Gammaproteobacteria bacterium]MYK47542.1 DUF2332 domain-containing protein [Gammaproteobacteria bacterium]